MAIYHCSVKVISRAVGRSATAAAAYRAGAKIEDRRSGITHDYTQKRGVDHCEILAPADSPDWAYDRIELWNRVEESEKRKDSQLAREVEIALPRELTFEQQRALATRYIREQFVDRGMVADICIHHAGRDNPHAHVMLTMRGIGSDGFGQKCRQWNDRQLLEQWRVTWQEYANDALERAGVADRIDHRTLADQGLERLPQIHQGNFATEMVRTGRPERSKKASLNLEIIAHNSQLQRLRERQASERTTPARKTAQTGSQAPLRTPEDIGRAIIALQTRAERETVFRELARGDLERFDAVDALDLVTASGELTATGQVWRREMGLDRDATISAEPPERREPDPDAYDYGPSGPGF